MKRCIALLSAILMGVSFTACGSSDSTVNETYNGGNMISSDMKGDYDLAAEYPDSPELGAAGAEAALPANRKLIVNYTASIQTLEFDNAIAQLEDMTAKSGGYIESSSRHGSGAIDYGRVYARSASYTLRVPANRVGELVDSLSSIGTVVDSSRGVEDVTNYYYDIDAHLKTLRTQETRLLELLAEADSVETMITIENALSDVRYQIESLDGTMRRLDEEIDYSRVDICIDEVFTPEEIHSSPLTLGERIVHRFKSTVNGVKNSGEDLIVFLLGDILILAPLAVLIFAAVRMYKRRGEKLFSKHNEPKNDEK